MHLAIFCAIAYFAIGISRNKRHSERRLIRFSRSNQKHRWMQTQRYSFTDLGIRNDTSSLKDIFAETLKRQNDGCNHWRSNRERVMDAEFDFFIPPSTGDNRVARREAKKGL